MLPQSAADYLTAVGQTALESKRRLDAMVSPAEAGFPALWTDYDVSTGRCTWVEQWFDADNQRATKPRGRSGSPTNMPAYPVGGGTIPDFAEAGSGSGSGTTSGVEVWLRPRICTQDQGQAFEFDWPDSGGGGAGSEATYTEIPSMPVGLTESGGYSTVMTVSLEPGTYILHANPAVWMECINGVPLSITMSASGRIVLQSGPPAGTTISGPTSQWYIGYAEIVSTGTHRFIFSGGAFYIATITSTWNVLLEVQGLVTGGGTNTAEVRGGGMLAHKIA
jgi:hypothetical protein